jgi:ABC-type transport system involved in cytochrome c biogenesis permease component
MRWLLQKDLRILRRSPLLVALLVVYPVGVSLLLGLALSRGPDKPKVAIVNALAQAGDPTFALGDRQVDPTDYARRLYEVVDPVDVASRERALEMVRDGEVLGALIVPEDVTQRLESTLALGAGEPPTLEVIYSTQDPVQAQIVDGLISSRLAQANEALSQELVRVAGDYLQILLRGGSFALLGRQFDVLGLQRTVTLLQATLAELPADSPAREDLQRIERFAQLAVDNLDLSDEILGAVGRPIRVQRTPIGGAAPPLEAFAVSAAVALSLAFVTVLLGAGLLALEREEHAFGRLVRGLVSRERLLAAKALLAALCGGAAALLMLAVLAPLVDLELGRLPAWLLAVAAGAAGLGALGVALGALAREVRAASLLAILLILPLTLLAVVPDGAVGGAVSVAADVVGAVFPVDPALRALDSALHRGDGLAAACAHAAGLAVAWLAVARLALRRFA